MIKNILFLVVFFLRWRDFCFRILFVGDTFGTLIGWLDGLREGEADLFRKFERRDDIEG